MTRSLAAAALLVAAIAPLPAQSLTAPSEWTFTNAQGSYCLGYLVEPEAAAKLAPKGSVLAPAGRGEGLHPAVTRQVQDEPEFARWIPGSVCIGLYESVSVNGEQVAAMKPEKPILVVTHTLAATSYLGAPVSSVLLGFYSDNSGVSRAADRTGQVIERVSRTLLKVPEGQDPRIVVQFDGVKLDWQGAARGDSRVMPTRPVSFGYTAQRGNSWIGAMETSGGEGKTQYGALGVEGKNNLAKALLASPIRAMGPLERGSSVKLSLTFSPEKGSPGS